LLTKSSTEKVDDDDISGYWCYSRNVHVSAVPFMKHIYGRIFAMGFTELTSEIIKKKLIAFVCIILTLSSY
jgi:hypothetical protein